MKSRVQRVRLTNVLIFFLIIFMLQINLFTTVAATPELMGVSVTPRTGEPDDELLFLITYTDSENKAPEYVRLVVDNKKYELVPVNPTDSNYTDGKNYKTKLKLAEGTHIFYFEASNGQESTSSLAATLQIKPENQFTHLDVAYSLLIATVLILIPMIYGLYQLKKLAVGVDKLVGEDKVKEKGKKK